MRALVVALVLLGVLSACIEPANSRPSATGARTATPIASGAGIATPTTAPTSTTVAARPAFLSFVFTDVRDGTQFKLTDFPGKAVLVIGMAVW